MEKVSKPKVAWGITYVGRSNEVALHSIRETRTQAIKDWLSGSTWDYWRSRGCEAVKVTVARITKETGHE